ncbi:PTPN14 family protein [Megaselia abdita]
MRWIDLDRPLSRQLKKHGSNQKIFLRVMYYVRSGVNLLTDEQTKYYYFLQLKSNLSEGKLFCDVKEVLILGLLTRQSEYDREQNQNLTYYLKRFMNSMAENFKIDSETLSDAFIENLIEQNKNILYLTQSQAEVLYIQRCQQLEGYGQERFKAKNSSGQDVTLCITLSGILIITMYYANQTSEFISWHNVQNVVNIKRIFKIEQCDRTLSFVFSESELSRYFWQLCVLQHKFFMKFEKDHQDESNNNENWPNKKQQHFDIQCAPKIVTSNVSLSTVTTNNSSFPKLPISEKSSYGQSLSNIPRSLTLSISDNRKVYSTSCLDLSYNAESVKLKSLLPGYRPAPDYETAVRQIQNSVELDNLNYNAARNNKMVNPLLRTYPDITKDLNSTLDLENFDRTRHLCYTAHSYNFSSTPDLHLYRNNGVQYVSGSSPDLLCFNNVGKFPEKNHRESLNNSEIQRNIIEPIYENIPANTIYDSSVNESSASETKIRNVSTSEKAKKRIWKILSRKSSTVPVKVLDRSRNYNTLNTFDREMLCNELANKLKTDLSLEYSQIPLQKMNASYNVANLEENKILNNNQFYIPYDDNRVRITPTMDNRLGYINTSYITATIGNIQKFYIIGQTPHNKLQALTFWQAVYESDVYMIINVGDENIYSPKEFKTIEFGQLQIHQELYSSTSICTTSKLDIYNHQSRRHRKVWHLNYEKWTTENIPSDIDIFLKFTEELHSIKIAAINELTTENSINKPVFIHCNNGCERSGLMLSIDIILYAIDHNQDLDVQKIITNLRQQRSRIITSVGQYRYLYSLIVKYLKNSRLI